MEAYEKAAVEIAIRAGNLLQEKRNEEREIDYKGEADLVTDADTASEKMITEFISQRFPDHGIVAEEGSEKDATSDFSWIIDPLDGTTNYAHNFPVYCVSIGMLYQDQVILGVIYNPILDELFRAIPGEGAYLNDRLIKVSKENRLSNSLLATGFPYDKNESDRDNVGYFAAFTKGIRGIRRLGSAALDLAYVACGRLDGFWELKLKPWDIAAGILMVKEAGGQISGFSGEILDLQKGDVVASNGVIHSDMLETIKSVDERSK
ncbi:MAG: inositol monophosphatase [candidate division Zixibacteria bacterium]|nr:inositol monophosphatase [candidate division Zixibacteria bacterium]